MDDIYRHEVWAASVDALREFLTQSQLDFGCRVVARPQDGGFATDVYASEPKVPQELIAMDNVVLFPHVGSATVATRSAMDQLVVDNLLAWGSGKPPLTPVPETPWPPKKRA